MSKSFEEDNLLWDRMLKRDGSVRLAMRIAKLPSYKKYAQRWPYDESEPALSLDLMEQFFESGDPTVDIVGDYAAQEWVEDFYQALTSKQRAIAELLVRGYSPKEILELPEYRNRYRNTGGIRYHKHAIRKRFRDQE